MTIADHAQIEESEWRLLDEMLQQFAADAGRHEVQRNAGERPACWAGFADLGLLDMALESGAAPMLGLFVERMAEGFLSHGLVNSLAFAQGDGGIVAHAGRHRVAAVENRLSGRIPALEAGDCADWFVASDGGDLYLIAMDAPGLSRSPVTILDGGLAADIVLDDAAATRIDGADKVRLGALLNAAEMIGLMRTLLDDTRGYLGVRRQFGQPIGRFQALRHRVADMHIALSESRACLYRALASNDAEVDAAAIVTSLRAARLIGREAIQMHGGMGMSRELRVGIFAKRLLMLQQRWGGVDDWLERLAA